MINKNLFYPLLCAIINSIVFLLTEIALVRYALQPLFFTFFVSTISGLFLFCFVKNRIAQIKNIFTVHPLLILFVGICNALAYLFAYYATTIIGATKVTFFIQLEIVFIIILAVFFLREKLTPRSYIAGFLIIIGGSFLNFSFTDFFFTFSRGDLFGLLAAFCFSVAIILITVLLQIYDILFITALGLLLAGIFLFFLYLSFFSTSLFVVSRKLLLFLLILGILEGNIWILYNLGLKRVGASFTSIIFGTLPFFTFLFSFIINFFISGFFILPKNLWSVFFGGILMFFGIVLIYWKNAHVLAL